MGDDTAPVKKKRKTGPPPKKTPLTEVVVPSAYDIYQQGITK